ncbi:DAK2 domain-containing protein [Knoellia sp. Soil729]|uniref:DAK2 domain-containing protein n=1 Tax=Knoellia sp. Soil729 TaxID=1736394 RepID=UPI0006FA9221|nr:DAK2 domain-containing protein [Knoellia sp. Soil729]KRE41938.1 dihydroxyacetone kinase [Knoellia sp. Soil729]
MPAVLDADGARQWGALTRAAFAARRAEIDGLNVFPVPDGDTGTNLYLTIDTAINEVNRVHGAQGILGTASLVDESRNLSRAMLMSARGNSGVIVSQIVAGISQVIVEEELTEVDGAALARAVTRGAELARASVAHPQEGTILSVADAVAVAARERADAGGDAIEVAAAAVAAAETALARTPEQLPTLARAGVVDAGGAGCLLMIEALHRALTGDWNGETGSLHHESDDLGPRASWHAEAVPAAVADGAGSEQPMGGLAAASPHDPLDAAATGLDGPAFEVMFLLDESDAERVAMMRTALDGLGNSLLVVGGPDLWNVHVHVDDVGAAIETGIQAGRPHRIRVTHFATQIAAREPQHFAVVACAAGPGMASVLSEAGAEVVLSAPGARASAGQLLDAIRRTGAASVVVLPNDKDTLMAAEVACRGAKDDGIDTAIIPARTAVQGLAALAVVDFDRGLRENVIAMTGAAVSTRHGAVSIASREVLTWAGSVSVGDILGIVSGDVALIGDDLTETAVEVLNRLLSGGGELVTLVSGAEADPDFIDAVEARIAKEHAEVEVVRIAGGQQVYPLLVGVE